MKICDIFWTADISANSYAEICAYICSIFCAASPSFLSSPSSPLSPLSPFVAFIQLVLFALFSPFYPLHLPHPFLFCTVCFFCKYLCQKLWYFLHRIYFRKSFWKMLRIFLRYFCSWCTFPDFQSIDQTLNTFSSNHLG